MGEQRPVAVALEIAVVGGAAVIESVERSERSDNISPRNWTTCPSDSVAPNAYRVCYPTSNATGLTGRIETRQATARNDAAVGKATILIAETQIVANGQFFVRVKAADQPVELAVKRFALQTQFLREGVELAVGIIARRAVEDIDLAIIGVRSLTRTILAIGGYRR